MNSMSILDAWTSFAADLIPLDAPDVQRIEMRRAFYSGAITILQYTWQLAASPDVIGSMRTLDRLHAEKTAFIAEMERLAREPK
jgi:hypothetical protein